MYGLGFTPFGHSLTKLMGNLKNQKINVSTISSSCKKLDLHYIPSRYPNSYPSGSPYEYHDESIAEEAIKNSENVINFVKSVKK